MRLQEEEEEKTNTKQDNTPISNIVDALNKGKKEEEEEKDWIFVSLFWYKFLINS